MNSTEGSCNFSISVPYLEKSYCSKYQRYTNPTTAFEGLEVVREIFKQRQFCFHDISRISTIYKTIDLAEQNADRAVSVSNLLFQKIINNIWNLSNIPACEVIKLHYLQLFFKDLPVKEYFEQCKARVDKKEIANELFFCHSLEQFEKDIDLLGLTDRKAQRILSRKRELYEQICRKKSDLEELQREDPQIYPLYLNKFLRPEFLHLYDYLIRVKSTLSSKKECSTEILNRVERELSCADFASTILEIQATIVQRVKNALPADLSGKNIFFILGATKSGKSTTLCFLRGDEMVLKRAEYFSKSDQKGIIGKDTWSSCTFLPTVEVVNDLVLIDFPGFNDTHGRLLSIGIKLALKKLINDVIPRQGRKIKGLSEDAASYYLTSAPIPKVFLLLLTPFSTEENGAHLKNLNKQIKNIFGTIRIKFFIGITKYSKNYLLIDLIKQKKIHNKIVKLKKDIDQHQDLIEKCKCNTDHNQLQELKQKKEKKLGELEKEVISSEEIEELKTEIKNVEKHFLNEMGILESECIKFNDLESLGNLTSIYNRLKNFSGWSVYCLEYIEWNSSEKKLIDFYFTQKIRKEVANFTSVSIPKYKDSISILDTNLISILFKRDIANLLQNFEPGTTSGYDKNILTHVLNIYISYILESVKNLLNKVKSKISEDLTEEIKRLKKYLIDLQKKHGNIFSEKEFIKSIIDLNQIMSEEEIYEKITIEWDNLITVYTIQMLVNKKNKVNAYLDESISFESIKLITRTTKEKIKNFRNLYGKKDWDIAAAFLQKRVISQIVKIESISKLFNFDTNQISKYIYTQELFAFSTVLSNFSSSNIKIIIMAAAIIDYDLFLASKFVSNLDMVEFIFISNIIKNRRYTGSVDSIHTLPEKLSLSIIMIAHAVLVLGSPKHNSEDLT